MKHKAGLVPYYRKDNEVFMLFMVSSDSDFGGDLPQIAKGNVDRGEEIADAAVREAQEELGLAPDNIVPNTFARAWDDSIVGLEERYHMTVYCAEVADPQRFNQPDRETAQTLWMTAPEFNQRGRAIHRDIVRAVDQLTKNAE